MTWSIRWERAYFMPNSINTVSITPALKIIRVYSLRVGMTRSYTCIEKSEVPSAKAPMNKEARTDSNKWPR